MTVFIVTVTVMTMIMGILTLVTFTNMKLAVRKMTGMAVTGCFLEQSLLYIVPFCLKCCFQNIKKWSKPKKNENTLKPN